METKKYKKGDTVELSQDLANKARFKIDLVKSKDLCAVDLNKAILEEQPIEVIAEKLASYITAKKRIELHSVSIYFDMESAYPALRLYDYSIDSKQGVAVIDNSAVEMLEEKFKKDGDLKAVMFGTGSDIDIARILSRIFS